VGLREHVYMDRLRNILGIIGAVRREGINTDCMKAIMNCVVFNCNGGYQCEFVETEINTG
jgi:hypothetical protein